MRLQHILVIMLLLPTLAAAQTPEAPQYAGPFVEIEPERPTTRDEVRVHISGKASCPHVSIVERVKNDVIIELATGCPLAPPLRPEEYDFEVELGRLTAGKHPLRVVGPGGALRFTGEIDVSAAVKPIAFYPARPNARDPLTVTVTLEGFALCELSRGAPRVRGHYVVIDYDDDCLAPPPAVTPAPTVSFQVTLEPLAATFYRAQLRDSTHTIVATADLVVQPADRCLTGDGSLCLQGGRFRARATYKKPDGSQGVAQPIAMGDDSGIFWFHDRHNAELVVKVLNACVPPYNHFWVYTAGLTDRETVLTVTDLRSGQSRTYKNRQGKSFAPVHDTRAFATCP